MRFVPADETRTLSARRHWADRVAFAFGLDDPKGRGPRSPLHFTGHPAASVSGPVATAVSGEVKVSVESVGVRRSFGVCAVTK